MRQPVNTVLRDIGLGALGVAIFINPEIGIFDLGGHPDVFNGSGKGLCIGKSLVRRLLKLGFGNVLFFAFNDNVRLGAGIVVVDNNIRLFSLGTHGHFDELADTLGWVIVGQDEREEGFGLDLLFGIGVVAALILVQVSDVFAVIIQRDEFLLDSIFNY